MYRGKIANGEIVADDDEVQVLTMALLNLFTRCWSLPRGNFWLEKWSVHSTCVRVQKFALIHST